MSYLQKDTAALAAILPIVFQKVSGSKIKSMNLAKERDQSKKVKEGRSKKNVSSDSMPEFKEVGGGGGGEEEFEKPPSLPDLYGFLDRIAVTKFESQFSSNVTEKIKVW